jgi:hypothetical protein
MKQLGEPQIPAVGILERQDFGDSKYYQVACKCGCGSDLQLNVEVDDCGIAVNTWTQVKSPWWKKRFDVDAYSGIPVVYSVLYTTNDWLNRLSWIWTIITKGYVEMESWTMMDRQQTLNFAETLKRAITDVEDFQALSRAEQVEKRNNT